MPPILPTLAPRSSDTNIGALQLPHPVPNDLAELIARRFRVIGEPMRIRLLDRLRDGEATVTELTEALDASQHNIS